MAQIYDPYGYEQHMYAKQEAYVRQMQNEQARALGTLNQGMGASMQRAQADPVSQPEPNKVLLLLE